MGKNKKNRSKQRKAKVAEKSATEQAVDCLPVVPDPFPELINFHPEDDIDGLLDFIHKGKLIDGIKLAKFLPNTAKDCRDENVTTEDIFYSIVVASRSKPSDISEEAMRQLGDAIPSLFGRSTVSKDCCWQCAKVAPHDLSVCAGCNTANYCSAECQRQAWDEGHKNQCSLVEGKFQRLKESYDIIEDTHNDASLYPGANFDIFSDYCMVSTIHGYPRAPLFGIDEQEEVEEILEPPSMEFFYHNLARIQQGWYPLSSAALATNAEGNEETDKHEFIFIAQALSFDLLTYCSIMYPEATHLEKMVDFVPLLNKKVSMSAERFLELYYTGQETWTLMKEKKLDNMNHEQWRSVRRQLKRAAIEGFRLFHHTGTFE